LYELFEVSDRYKTAVEVTGGTRWEQLVRRSVPCWLSSLFHVVVDTDETASKILDVMNKEKGGRVTFMPLNRLKSAQINYPKANDAIPMINKLKFDRAYVMAFEQVRALSRWRRWRQVFGRTIICEDLGTAAQYTRSHGLNAVTVEGDRADRKGALTGGYHDVRRSRLDSVKAVKKWREAYETDSARHREVKEGIQKLDQQMTQALGQIQVLEAKRKQALEYRARHANEASWTQREVEQSSARVSAFEKELEAAEVELRRAAAKRTSHEEELKTPMRQQLTDVEIKSLESLTKDAEEEKQALVAASKERQKVSSFGWNVTDGRFRLSAARSKSSSRKTCGDGVTRAVASWTTLRATLEVGSSRRAKWNCGKTRCGILSERSRHSASKSMVGFEALVSADT
jgi:structural maintenance of chromosome 3 (chondroitin sulfate proteoglycan 6)